MRSSWSISIPFLEAIKSIPAYVKFLKDILANKSDVEVVNLTKGSTLALLNQLESQPKLKDPGSFTIPVKLKDTEINKALCDLGASVSVMPIGVYKRIGGTLRPTNMTIQLADRSIQWPVDILEDVPVQIGKSTILTDFVVLDINEEENTPIDPS